MLMLPLTVGAAEINCGGFTDAKNRSTLIVIFKTPTVFLFLYGTALILEPKHFLILVSNFDGIK